MPQEERIPPHSDEAEKSVLGSILIDKEIFFKVSEFINADDFYSGSHKEIYNAMVELYREDAPIDVITVSDKLNKRGSLDFCGGRMYISELSAEVPTTANAVQYAKIIQEKSIYRQLIRAGSSIVENSLAEKFDASTVLDEAESSIFEISKERQSKDYSKISNIIANNIEEIKKASENPGGLPGLSTGFTMLDGMTSGLQKSDFIILAARPSMGKTAFSLNLAQHAAVKLGKRVAFFSVEMSEDAVGLRFLAMESRVDVKRLKNGNLSVDDWESVEEAKQRLGRSDLLVDATPGISVMEVRNKCRRMNAERKLDLVIIDYLQIMSSGSKIDNRVNEVALMTRQLKQLAREIECPLIVLSQLSRSTVQRDGDKRPQLSDLRDSGSIEQDADVVMFLHREDYYKKPEQEPTNVCEVIIAKQRQGETGTVKLAWMPRYQKFGNLANENQEFGL